MAKKQTRNKFRDIIGDYYLTNREITKHYDREHKKDKEEDTKKTWKRSEKIMIMVTGAAVVLLAIKYLVL